MEQNVSPIEKGLWFLLKNPLHALETPQHVLKEAKVGSISNVAMSLPIWAAKGNVSIDLVAARWDNQVEQRNLYEFTGRYEIKVCMFLFPSFVILTSKTKTKAEIESAHLNW